jgi:hypothetical protein
MAESIEQWGDDYRVDLKILSTKPNYYIVQWKWKVANYRKNGLATFLFFFFFKFNLIWQLWHSFSITKMASNHFFK